MPKVSVIVPVYGVEKYIERCARSLFEQTLDDMEYLFIDDCTPDKSIEILKVVAEKYPQRKSQILIHHMDRNLGQAAVRKWGMKNATGDYIIHCDSDDWVEKDMYEKLWKKAIEGNYDIVRCNFVRTDGIHRRLCRQIPVSDYNDKMRLISNILIGSSLTSLCDKLVKRSILDNNIIYPKSDMQEDASLVIQIVYYSKKICFLPDVLYYYCANPSSITHKSTIESHLKKLNEVMDNTKIILDFLENKGILSNFSEEIVCRKYNDRSHIIQLTSKKEYRKLWWKIYPEIDSKVLFNGKMKWNEKLEYYLVKYRLYFFVQKVKAALIN